MRGPAAVCIVAVATFVPLIKPVGAALYVHVAVPPAPTVTEVAPLPQSTVATRPPGNTSATAKVAGSVGCGLVIEMTPDTLKALSSAGNCVTLTV